MNLNTGEIKLLSDAEDERYKEELERMSLSGFMSSEVQKLHPISLDEATSKQRTNMKVSLNDHRSKLGIILTEERRKRGISNGSPRVKRKRSRKNRGVRACL